MFIGSGSGLFFPVFFSKHIKLGFEIPVLVFHATKTKKDGQWSTIGFLGLFWPSVFGLPDLQTQWSKHTEPIFWGVCTSFPDSGERKLRRKAPKNRRFDICVHLFLLGRFGLVFKTYQTELRGSVKFLFCGKRKLGHTTTPGICLMWFQHWTYTTGYKLRNGGTKTHKNWPGWQDQSGLMQSRLTYQDQSSSLFSLRPHKCLSQSPRCHSLVINKELWVTRFSQKWPQFFFIWKIHTQVQIQYIFCAILIFSNKKCTPPVTPTFTKVTVIRRFFLTCFEEKTYNSNRTSKTKHVLLFCTKIRVFLQKSGEKNLNLEGITAERRPTRWK